MLGLAFRRIVGASVALAILSSAAFALEPVDGVASRDFGKRFQETGAVFDHIQMFMASVGDQFTQPVGVDLFTPAGWTQTKNTGLLLLADGQPLDFSEFTVHFVGAVGNPLQFYFQAWNDRLLVEEKTVTYDGAVWTVVPGSPWADVRIDATLLQLIPVHTCFDVGQTFTIDLKLRHAQTLIRGGQFFLAYDNTRIDLVNIAAGEPPFTMEVFRQIREMQGLIDFAVGVPNGQPGTLEDTVMARLTFTSLVPVCAMPGLLQFRPHVPATCLSDEIGERVDPALLSLPPLSFGDMTAPVLINMPADITVDVAPGLCERRVEWIAPTAEDDCGPVVPFRVTGPPSGSVFLGGTKTLIEYKAIDACGNEVVDGFFVEVLDRESPLLSMPEDITIECGASIDPADTGKAFATDNCDAAPLIEYEDTIVEGACPAEKTITRNWKATDIYGNFLIQPQIIEVVDTTPPVVTPPAAIHTHLDAGLDTASVNLLEPFALDNCDTLVQITATRNDGLPVTAPYPQGVTTVVWRAEDDCGNHCNCTQLIFVDDQNLVMVDVELSPTILGQMTRCMTFEFWTGHELAPTPTFKLDQVVTFTNGLALGVEVAVPADDYACMTARDKLHTLRQTDETFGIVGPHYVAHFTGDPLAGGSWLIGGNLNDDAWIDILDFGAFAAKWGQNYGTPDTTCQTTKPHSDISGDGLVWTEDFTFIQVNFLKGREAQCFGWPEPRDSAPCTRISVAELRQRGMGNLAAGDLNRDGWLDELDVAAFLGGARPRVRVPIYVFPVDLLPEGAVKIDAEP